MPVAEKKKSMAKAVALSNEGSGPNRVGSFITRTTDFLKDVRGEMRKVTTPSRAEVQSTTTVVIFTVFAFAAFFYAVDTVLDSAVKALVHWLGGVS
jgi:preprotein translocase subunit SecE